MAVLLTSLFLRLTDVPPISTYGFLSSIVSSMKFSLGALFNYDYSKFTF
jgi:hypothetical protein